MRFTNRPGSAAAFKLSRFASRLDLSRRWRSNVLPSKTARRFERSPAGVLFTDCEIGHSAPESQCLLATNGDDQVIAGAVTLGNVGGNRLRLLILSGAGSARSGTVIAKKDVDFANGVRFNGQDPVSRRGKAPGRGSI